jgi:hypothetical protein
LAGSASDVPYALDPKGTPLTVEVGHTVPQESDTVMEPVVPTKVMVTVAKKQGLVLKSFTA